MELDADDSTGATTAPGSYTVTVTGTGASATHTTTVSLTVLEAAADDFSVVANPENITAKQGAAAPTSIETTTVWATRRASRSR